MQKVWSTDGEIYGFLSKALDLAVLNLLVVLFSLPIVTMGSAVSAAYHVMFDETEKGSTKIVRSYLLLFKQHLVKGMELSITFLLLMGILTLAVRITFQTPFQFISLLLLAFCGILMLTTFMNLAYFDKSFTETLKLSLAISLKYTGFLCFGFTLFAISFLIPVFLPKLLFIWFFFGISIPLLLNVKIYLTCIERIEKI